MLLASCIRFINGRKYQTHHFFYYCSITQNVIKVDAGFKDLWSECRSLLMHLNSIFHRFNYLQIIRMPIRTITDMQNENNRHCLHNLFCWYEGTSCLRHTKYSYHISIPCFMNHNQIILWMKLFSFNRVLHSLSSIVISNWNLIC